MNLIRKIKISEIVPVEFSKTEQEIIELFNDKLKDLVVFIDESYPHEINYMKSDGTVIMQQDNKNDKLLVIYLDFWSDLNFNMYFTDIQILIQFMVERILKCKVSTTIPISRFV